MRRPWFFQSGSSSLSLSLSLSLRPSIGLESLITYLFQSESWRSTGAFLFQSRNHVGLRQHPYVKISVRIPIARQMRRNDRRDSGARFLSEGSPRLHFAGLYIHPKDLCGFRGDRAASADGSYIYRLAIFRPANDVVPRFEPR